MTVTLTADLGAYLLVQWGADRVTIEGENVSLEQLDEARALIGTALEQAELSLLEKAR